MKNLRIEHRFTSEQWHNYREHLSELSIKHLLKRGGIAALDDFIACKKLLNLIPYPKDLHDHLAGINNRHRTGPTRSTNG